MGGIRMKCGFGMRDGGGEAVGLRGGEAMERNEAGRIKV